MKRIFTWICEALFIIVFITMLLYIIDGANEIKSELKTAEMPSVTFHISRPAEAEVMIALPVEECSIPKEEISETALVVETEESIGNFQLTAYCPCDYCSEGYGRGTATGAVATAGRTIAVDPSVIPYGTVVEINGHEYVAEDCGGAINDNRIDIFFDTHEEAMAFGVQYADVYEEN